MISLSKRRRIAVGITAATLVAIAAAADARPAWRPLEDRLDYGEPTGGEAYYPAIACAANALTVTIIPSERAVGLRRDRSNEWIDARGRHGPWPIRTTVRSGRSSMVVTGQLAAEGEGFPEVFATVPVTSAVGRAILASGVVDASARGQRMHVPPIPRPLLARLRADCRRTAG